VVALQKLVDELDVDVVHSHMTYAGNWCAALRAGGKVRMVHSVREQIDRVAWYGRKFLWPKIIARADRLVCEYASVEADLVGKYSAAKGKTVVIPDGIDPNRAAASRTRADVRSEMGIPSDAMVVLQVAPVTDRNRGHLQLIEAMRKVCNEFPYTYLLVAGDLRNLGLLDELNERINGLELHRRVNLLAARDDVADLLGASDIYVAPALEDGEPTVLVEAMMAGLPVVATTVGACPEVVKDSETGILVPPGESDALATAIMELSANPAWRQRLAAAGKEMAMDTYSLERVGARHAEMYRALVAGEPAKAQGG
jgi:glycosyltransferase involved in cell wall biosynthesis